MKDPNLTIAILRFENILINLISFATRITFTILWVQAKCCRNRKAKIVARADERASRFVGVSKTAETMKRSPTSELNDLTYTKKKEKNLEIVCKICKTPEMHLHRLTVSEAAKLSKWYNLDLLSDYRVCCRHFVPHTNEVFSKKHRPALLKDATEFQTAAPTRKAPPQRILAPPPTPIGMCTA
jgi:hypothetical protein